MKRSKLKAMIKVREQFEYTRKLVEAGRKTGIREIMDIINSTDLWCMKECFGENPTPESLIEIYEKYYKEA